MSVGPGALGSVDGVMVGSSLGALEREGSKDVEGILDGAFDDEGFWDTEGLLEGALDPEGAIVTVGCTVGEIEGSSKVAGEDEGLLVGLLVGLLDVGLLGLCHPGYLESSPPG